MATDSLGRTITYARISLTEACNFACPYCRPADQATTHIEPALSVEQWIRILEALPLIGIKAIRLTGGEPLLYPGLLELLERCTQLGLFEDISLTTNASLLAPMAHKLRAAGLNRINISLDGLTEERFHKNTGGRGSLQTVLEGIEAAVDAGLGPVKINTVLTEPFSRAETEAFLAMMMKWPVVWRFIEYMPFQGQTYRGPSFMEWKERLEEVVGGNLQPTTIEKGFGPAQYFAFPNGNKVGFIFPMTNPYCENCNRIRITSEGQVRLCLLRPEECAIVTEDFDNLTTQQIANRIQGFLQARHAQHDGRDSMPEKDMWKIGG